MKQNLDFICIGAPKAATSTLFELIEGHPEIYVPPAKEVPFFNDDETYKKGWDWYMKTFFSDAKKDQVVGTMTPQYMSGYGTNTPERIAERISKQMPNGKIIALLRHPVERSFSQHKMHRRYGFLTEMFDDSVSRLLNKKDSDLNKERSNLSQKNMFLFASEYGRILSKYYTLFPKKNILVLYTDDFQRDPEAVLKKIFRFLNVNQSYVPENVNRHSHKGSGTAKIKYLTPGYLKKAPAINFLWKSLVPVKLRKKIFMMITRWNIKPDNDTLNRQSKTYKRLVDFFTADVALLEKVTGSKVPWKDWK